MSIYLVELSSGGGEAWVRNGVTPYGGGRSWFKFKSEPDWDPWEGPDPDLIFAIYLGGSTTPTDTTDPVLSLPADITQEAVDANGAPVNFEVSATDNEDPNPQVSCERGTPPTAVSSGATFALGTTTVTCTATDAAGNTATGSFDVSVLFSGFSGFFTPVENAPTLNVVKAPAGKAAIRVKFSLGGDVGLDVFEEGYPLSKSTACPNQSPTDVVEETVAAEPSDLKYDAAANQYIYTWKTESAWKGTCRELNLRLEDGTDHKAVFQFTK